MDITKVIKTYEDSQALLWKLRLELWSSKNDVGHDFICRVQGHLKEQFKLLILESA